VLLALPKLKLNGLFINWFDKIVTHTKFFLNKC
jgi:hypothetical protein